MATSTIRHVLALLVAAAVAPGCASSKKPVAPDGENGTGTAAGSVAGTAYDKVADARWIGTPDDPQRTRVVYVFDKLVSCSALSASGWDQVVTDGTQALEMKVIGTTTGDYAVSPSGRAGAGEANVNYTVTSTSGTPAETLVTGGSVKLTSLVDGQSADGGFDLAVSGDSVSGTFHATYCADGREP